MDAAAVTLIVAGGVLVGRLSFELMKAEKELTMPMPMIPQREDDDSSEEEGDEE